MLGAYLGKIKPGSPLRGRGTPAYPARLRSERARNLKTLLLVVVAAQEFVALDRRHDANRALVARFRPLNAPEAADPNGSRERNFIRQGQQDFDGRAFLYVLAQKEVNPTGADVPRFGARFAHRRTRCPADGKRKAHLKALCCAAFRTGQGQTLLKRSKSLSACNLPANRPLGPKMIQPLQLPIYKQQVT